MRQLPDMLIGQWTHWPEEDHEGHEVYRRANVIHPASRGREKIDLQPDGIAIFTGISASDRPATARQGSWQLVPPTSLRIQIGASLSFIGYWAAEHQKLVLNRGTKQ
jgi:hypothetical protein